MCYGLFRQYSYIFYIIGFFRNSQELLGRMCVYAYILIHNWNPNAMHKSLFWMPSKKSIDTKHGVILALLTSMIFEKHNDKREGF